MVIFQARSPFSFPKPSANVRYRSLTSTPSANVRYRSLTSTSSRDFCQPSSATALFLSTLDGPPFSTAELANNFYNTFTSVLDTIMPAIRRRKKRKGKKTRVVKM